MSQLRVAIIGAGASDLTAIKSCLDEGFEPVCFEQESYLGGMWKFTEDNSISSSVYRSTVINTVKEMCYSDFPIPKEFPPYMHNTFVMKYFQMYAENFGLEEYICFGRRVLNVKRSGNFELSGKWLVTTKSIVGENDESKVECFDASWCVLDTIGNRPGRHLKEWKYSKVFRSIAIPIKILEDLKERSCLLWVGLRNVLNLVFHNVFLISKYGRIYQI